jgi:hypothetical protein
MTTKDSPPPAFNEVAGVQFSPVPAWNQPQPQTANMIIAALGGKADLPKSGDNVPRLEGYIPPGNRNGDSALEDRLLAQDKVARLHLKDTEPELGPFANTLDPRDNRDAPDEYADKNDKTGVA